MAEGPTSRRGMRVCAQDFGFMYSNHGQASTSIFTRENENISAAGQALEFPLARCPLESDLLTRLAFTNINSLLGKPWIRQRYAIGGYWMQLKRCRRSKVQKLGK